MRFVHHEESARALNEVDGNFDFEVTCYCGWFLEGWYRRHDMTKGEAHAHIDADIRRHLLSEGIEWKPKFR